MAWLLGEPARTSQFLAADIGIGAPSILAVSYVAAVLGALFVVASGYLVRRRRSAVQTAPGPADAAKLPS